MRPPSIYGNTRALLDFLLSRIKKKKKKRISILPYRFNFPSVRDVTNNTGQIFYIVVHHKHLSLTWGCERTAQNLEPLSIKQWKRQRFPNKGLSKVIFTVSTSLNRPRWNHISIIVSSPSSWSDRSVVPTQWSKHLYLRACSIQGLEKDHITKTWMVCI